MTKCLHCQGTDVEHEDLNEPRDLDEEARVNAALAPEEDTLIVDDLSEDYDHDEARRRLGAWVDRIPPRFPFHD